MNGEGHVRVPLEGKGHLNGEGRCEAPDEAGDLLIWGRV